MEQSKLIRTLSALTEHELKAFRKWAFEGQIKKQNDTFRLFDYVYQFAPSWSGEFMEKEKVFEILFPAIPYDDRIIRRIMSDLLARVKEYILLYVQKDDIQKDLIMADFYLNRKVLSEYTLIIDEIGRKQASISFDTEVSLFQQYQWENQKMVEYGITQISQKMRSFTPIMQALDIFYTATALYWSCVYLTNSGITLNPTTIERPIALEIIKANPHYLENLRVSLYYQTYLLWDEFETHAVYDEFQIWLQKNEHLINLEDQGIVAKCMRNYCIRKVREGKKEFHPKFEKLLELHFAKGFLFEMGYITYAAFNNMITIYLRQNKVTEAKKFVADYSQYLKEENKEGVLCLVEIKIDFAEKKYKEVLQKSSTMEGISDLILSSESRRWRAKAFFMLEEYESLSAHLEATRMNVHRNKAKLTDTRHSSYQSFVKYMRKLISINLYEKKEVQKLYSAISKEEDFTEKEWIMDTLLDKGAKPLARKE